MKYAVCALALVGCLLAPALASAVSISGIVLYAADDFGTPNGYKTHDGELQAQLWRTALGDDWYILGVWNGLPPQSLGAAPLNGPGFMVEIPLNDGENEFTLVGQPGSNTRADEFERFAINLYFDGILDRPGISVLFPRNNVPTGSPPSANRSDKIYSLGLNPVNVAPSTTYDDGIVSVSVTGVSYLEPERFGADVDLVSAQRMAPSGEGDPNASDYIGILKVMVEPSQGLGQPILGGGVAGGGVGSGINDGGGNVGGGVPIGGAVPGAVPRLIGQPQVAPDTGAGGGDARDVATASDDAPPAAVPGTATPVGSVTPEVTASPVSTASGASPTASAASTTTPGATGSPATTGTPATPSPPASKAGAAATPTPSPK